MKKSFNILGFDIGGTKIVVSLGDSSGKISGSKRIEAKDKTPEEILPKLVTAGKDLMAESKLKPSDIRAAGIGAPAPMDIPSGIILCPPNMKTWKAVPIRDYISENFGIETFFDNDANAGALAEWIFGAGQGLSDMLYLTMSTGIGGGIIAKGHLIQGKRFIAGEMGHITIDINGPQCNCGMKGCYEAFCGGRAVAQRMQRELADKPDHPIIKFAGGNINDVDMVALVKAVKTGNDYAINLWDEICLRNAQAIGAFINIFNPEMITMGTIAWATGDLFMEPLKRHLPRFCWESNLEVCKVVPSGLTTRIADYSGICVALNQLYERGEYKLPWQK